VAGETFQLTDAPRLVAAAQSRGIKLIAMWSANRDHSCDASGGALFQCSQITQQPFEFSRSFRAFTQ
jgi:hypothetical protein